MDTQFRTTLRQYEIMLNYMEKHGDLSTSGGDYKSRYNRNEQWNELINELHKDTRGPRRSRMKWQKVWSDYKNKVKMKRKKLHVRQAQCGCPSSEPRPSLSALERRVLTFVGLGAGSDAGDTETAQVMLTAPDSNVGDMSDDSDAEDPILSHAHVKQERHSASASDDDAPVLPEDADMLDTSRERKLSSNDNEAPTTTVRQARRRSGRRREGAVTDLDLHRQYLALKREIRAEKAARVNSLIQIKTMQARNDKKRLDIEKKRLDIEERNYDLQAALAEEQMKKARAKVKLIELDCRRVEMETRKLEAEAKKAEFDIDRLQNVTNEER